PARPPQGPRFRRGLGEELRQGPRLLHHARPRTGGMGSAGHAIHDDRRHLLGPPPRRRRHHPAPGPVTFPLEAGHIWVWGSMLVVLLYGSIEKNHGGTACRSNSEGAEVEWRKPHRDSSDWSGTGGSEPRRERTAAVAWQGHIFARRGRNARGSRVIAIDTS